MSSPYCWARPATRRRRTASRSRTRPAAHAAVLVYRRVPRGHGGKLGLQRGWKYAYDPEGKKDGRLRWPWSKPDAGPGDTPDGRRDDADG